MSVERTVMLFSWWLRWFVHCCTSPLHMCPLLVCSRSCFVIPRGLDIGVGSGIGSSGAAAGVGTSTVAS
eukprot:6207492-Pyramimonas_sp.AAC.1